MRQLVYTAAAWLEAWLERTSPQRSLVVGIVCLYVAALIMLATAAWLALAGGR